MLFCLIIIIMIMKFSQMCCCCCFCAVAIFAAKKSSFFPPCFTPCCGIRYVIYYSLLQCTYLRVDRASGSNNKKIEQALRNSSQIVSPVKSITLTRCIAIRPLHIKTRVILLESRVTRMNRQNNSYIDTLSDKLGSR